jgi:hypothetical protein
VLPTGKADPSWRSELGEAKLFLADPKLWVAAASLIVAIGSAIVSFFSFRNSTRAVAISERQEKRHSPRLQVYFANGYRRLVSKRQLFGFLVSVSNPTDINNSIARAELQITNLLSDGSKTFFRIKHNPEVAQGMDNLKNDAAHVFSLPARIDAHQTLSGWLLFVLDNEMVGNGTVDGHRLILEDTHGLATDTDPIMVRAWTDESQENCDPASRPTRA